MMSSDSDSVTRLSITSSSIDTVLTAATVTALSISEEESSPPLSNSSSSNSPTPSNPISWTTPQQSVGRDQHGPGRPPPHPGPAGPEQVRKLPAVRQPAGQEVGQIQARIWGRSEELLLSQDGRVPPAERRGLVGARPTQAARAGGTTAQIGAVGGLAPDEPPRLSGLPLTLTSGAADLTMAGVLKQLQQQQQRIQLQLQVQLQQLQQSISRAPETRAESPPWPKTGHFPEEGHPGYGPPDPGYSP